ncbi:MAG: hypothetical protein N2315_09075, partial [Thermanaerothrix sp.]|nr:hypothetical protein [Thermanaerothrix sp.]
MCYRGDDTKRNKDSSSLFRSFPEKGLETHGPGPFYVDRKVIKKQNLRWRKVQNSGTVFVNLPVRFIYPYVAGIHRPIHILEKREPLLG